METIEMLEETAAVSVASSKRDGLSLAPRASSTQAPGLLRSKISAIRLYWNRTLPPEERAGALLLMGNMFVLLTAYYILKTIREALILTEGGAEIKTYSSALQSALLVLALPLYSRIAARMRGFRLIASVTVFFASHLLLFSGAIAAGYHVGVAFYLWLGIFSVVMTSQMWAFASDVYTEVQGIRLFPVIGIGGAIGAIAGSRLAGKVFAQLDVQGTLLVATAILLAGLGLTWLATHRTQATGAKKAAKPAGNAADGFKLIARSRYLMLIAAAMILLNLVNTGGEYVIGKMVVEQSKALAAADQRAFVAGFYSNYLAWGSAIGLTLQMLLSLGAMRLIGVRGALLMAPMVALAGYGSLAILPLLTTAFIVKVFENGVDYSVGNTVRHALFLPTNPQEKYQAQTTIETFFYRAGDMTTALLVFAASYYHLAPKHFVLMNVAVALAWVAVAVAIAASYARKTAAPETEPEETTLHVAVRPSRCCTGWSSLMPSFAGKFARLACAIAALIVFSPAVLAQDELEPSREAEIEGQRDAKAALLSPEEVTRIERAMREIRDRKLFEKFTGGILGIKPKFGGMVPGGGFAAGPEFTQSFREGRVDLRASAQLSTRGYSRFEAEAGLNKLWNGRSTLSVLAARRNYTGLNYYGPGPDSSLSGRSNYRLEDHSIDLFGTVQPTRHVKLGASLGNLWVDVGPGSRDSMISSEQIYTNSQAAGLTETTRFFRNTAFAQFDYRDNPGGPKSGGNYVFQHSWYRDYGVGNYSFQRTDVDLQQIVPVLNKTRRIALRARGTFTHAGNGNRTPFYLQPVLGGSDDLRGYNFFRFSDRNAIVYNAEYQWEIFSGLDGALFMDAGQVMPHIRIPKFSDLETSAGFGLRFNKANSTFLRLDFAFSHEGARVWIKFSDIFNTRRFGTASGQPLY